MSRSKYGVLIGKVKKIKPDPISDRTPHYKVYVRTEDNEKYEVPINCKSIDNNLSKVLYYADDNYRADEIDILPTLDFRFHEIDYQNDLNSNIAVDFIRSGLFDPNEMRPLPYDIEGENDLKGFIDKNMKKALNNDKAIIYVYGTHYTRGGKGVHNVHMNQGNIEIHPEENRIYHDGCFLIHFTDEDKWVAYFLAFQSQSWCTDERGYPEEGSYRSGYPTGDCKYNTVKINSERD